MVVRKRRKITKQRGSRTCGRGCAKRGRGSGEKGGKGASGRHKHLWSWVIRYEPDYFGKRGFVRHAPKRTPIGINLDELEQLIPEWERAGSIEKDGDLYKVDLGKLGYTKLLGRGRITRRLEVKVESFSERAKRKVEEAGGRIISGEGDGGDAQTEIQAVRT